MICDRARSRYWKSATLLATAVAFACALLHPRVAAADVLELGPYSVADLTATPGCAPSCLPTDFPVDWGVQRTFSYTLKPGDQVISSTRFAEGKGGFAEYCQVHEAATLDIPRGMSMDEAAGFWVPFHTGYVGVIQRGQLQAGETLLVLGGAGSSGSAAIQLGKAPFGLDGQ